jgi:hypothetical protein
MVQARQLSRALRSWYIDACDEDGQSAAGDYPYGYGTYENGNMIQPAERRLYRERVDLRRAFPNPFSDQPKGGFSHWYRMNVDSGAARRARCRWQMTLPRATLCGSAHSGYGSVLCGTGTRLSDGR